MKVTIYRDDFKELKDYYEGKYQTLHCFDLMLMSEFGIKDTEDIDSIDVAVDDIKINKI